MHTHYLNSNKFYILSGPSASGKSSLTQQLLKQGLPEDAIVSTDTIRKNILGSSYSIDEYGIKETINGWEISNPQIFNIIENIIKIRLEQKLPTIFDATNLDEDTRKKYVELAATYGIESHIFIFNIEKDELKKRLSKRSSRFDFSVVERQLEHFSLTSIYPYSIVQPNDIFILLPNLLDTTNIDIVGDTHGLLNETIELLKSSGWVFKDFNFTHPDTSRKVLFLGDAIDRGTQSIELLQTIKNTVDNGVGYFILGNHEAKLMSVYQQYKKEGILRGRSISNSETVMKFLELNEKEQNDLFNFLLKSPIYYALWIDKTTGKSVKLENLKNPLFKIAFGHADNDYFNPYSFTKSHALYGKRKIDNKKDHDLSYQMSYNQGVNDYVFFRGHIPNVSKQNYIFSLEDNQAFSGNLLSLNINKYIELIKNNNWESKYSFFEESSVKQKTNFNFNDNVQDKVQFMKKMDELVKNGLASDGWRKDEHGVKNPHPDGFKIFKYSKTVHFKKLWKTEPLLEKARGIAIDISGDIIVHPFDKLYNYGEYDVGKSMNMTDKVQVIDKLNGFLGCISKHPFKDELLVSTTGSFKSDFVDYIQHFIDDATKRTLLNFFKDNKVTLMFEVIHPEDKHIIEYPAEDHGLWLIGARGLKFTDKIYTENQLDILAQQLNFKRPLWNEMSFQEVLNLLPNSTLEGYMIRDAKTEEPLMKIKTNYYLVTKFVGRMGLKMTEKMYKNPNAFKSNHMEEEFYPIVDKIIAKISQKDFEAMEQKQRVDFVRDIVDELRTEVSNSKTLKI